MTKLELVSIKRCNDTDKHYALAILMLGFQGKNEGAIPVTIYAHLVCDYM